MKRTTPTAIIVFALIVTSVTGIQTLEVAKANYFPPPSIEIFSPIPAPDVHSNASVPLDVRVNVLTSEPDITFIRYSLDGKANVTLNSLTREDNVWYWTTTKGVTVQGTAFRAEASLDDLADGNHTLTVHAHYADGKEMSRSREFTVDTQYKPYKPPELLILSPQNQTYTTTELPLTFAIDEPILSAHYMLDNQGGNASQSFTGNSTLTGLSNGMHKIIVTVWTERGTASQTTYFTIAQETEPQPEPFPPVLLITAVLVTTVLGALAIGLVLRKRRVQENKRKSGVAAI